MTNYNNRYGDMMRKRKGFTLIELLVVISIIALLLAILMPSLGMVKKKAQATVCKSNLKQWGLVFTLYTVDNDGRFWEDGPNASGHVRWLPMLSEMYDDMDEFRLCPSAKKPKEPAGMGSASSAWGGVIFQGHGFTGDVSRNFGSYGTNLWINSVEETTGWMGMPQRQWQTTTQKQMSQIPMILDCVWFGTNFVTIDDPAFSSQAGSVPPSRDFYEQMSPLTPEWGWLSGRVCIDRHSKKVNVSYMDGSTDSVMLSELWSLNWHPGYKKVTEVEIPWLSGR